jgi:hypothetical protein
MEIIAFMAAAMGLILAIDAHTKVGKLEKRLRENGLITNGDEPDDESN